MIDITCSRSQALRLAASFEHWDGEDAPVLFIDAHGTKCVDGDAFANTRGRRKSRPRPTCLRCLCGMPFAGAEPEHDRNKSRKSLEPQGGETIELSALFIRLEVFRRGLERQASRRLDQRSATSHSWQRDDVPGN